MTIRLLFTAALLLATAAIAACQTSSSLPKFDTVAFCRVVAASTPGRTPEEATAACYYVETDAQSHLAGMTIPPEVRAECERFGRSNEGGSYTMMERCVKERMGLTANG